MATPDNALFLAAYYGDARRIRELVQSGAPVDARTGDGKTPLMVAAFVGHCDAVAALIDEGADVAATDMYGKTALAWAEEQEHTEVVKRIQSAFARAKTSAGPNSGL